jgi:hypothetical protein
MLSPRVANSRRPVAVGVQEVSRSKFESDGEDDVADIKFLLQGICHGIWGILEKSFGLLMRPF